MGANDLKLLGAWFSPFAARVRIALNIKGLEYENIEETWVPKSDLLLQSNPVYKKIPVFIHGDKPVCESAIIVEYIDEVWKNNGTPSILPSNAYDRAMTSFWVAYIDDKWFKSMEKRLTAQDDESKKTYFDQMEEVLMRFEDVLKSGEGKHFFGGDKIGLIDIAFGSFLGWMWVTEKMIGMKVLDEAKTPNLAKWVEAFVSDPAVKGVLPETDKLLGFAKSFVQRLIDSSPK